MSTTFNVFDLIFIFSALIFIVFAYFRGFVKEIFALLSWIASLTISYFLAPFLAEFISYYSDSKFVINTVSSSVVFVVVFIIIAILFNKMAVSLQEKMPSNVDRLLGVVYGFFKTFLVFGLVYAVTLVSYAILLGEKVSEHDVKKHSRMPQWLEEAKCLPYIQGFGKMLTPFVEGVADSIMINLEEKSDKKKVKHQEEKNDEMNKKIDEIITDGGAIGHVQNGSDVVGKKKESHVESLEKSNSVAKKSSAKKTDAEYGNTGYSKKEIEKMNHLIDIVE